MGGDGEEGGSGGGGSGGAMEAAVAVAEGVSARSGLVGEGEDLFLHTTAPWPPRRKWLH